GDDVIETGIDNDTILGDGGIALYNAGVLVDLSSFALTSGNDDVTVANGNNIIVAGQGDDEITTGTGNDIIASDNVQLDFNNSGVLVRALSTQTDAGGIDTVIAAGGNNIIIAGSASDDITAGITTDIGNDIIAGDNVDLRFTDVGVLTSAMSIAPDQGDSDVIAASDGNNIIIAGLGNDDIEAGLGADIIAADNAEFTFTDAGVLVEAVSTSPSQAGNDIVVAGDGDNIIIAGSGVDEVTTGNDNDIIFGDNAKLNFNTQGQPVELLSTELDFGDVDTIVAGDGNNMIAGGRASDAITTGSGVDLVAGDNILITLTQGTPLQTIPTLMTPVDDIGGNDVINLGAGGAFVIAGAGDDEVTNAAGDSVIIGDQGTIYFAANGLYANAFTGDVDIVGNDRLTGGSDSDVIFGGSGTDLLSGNAGQDFLVGDAGMITRDDFLVTLESIAIDENSSAFISDDMSFFTGADDELDGGLDNDYMIGGFGNDLFTGDLSEDIMTGEYGRYRLTIDADQLITGLETSVTLAQGSLDLIRVVQQELYTAAPLTTGSLPLVSLPSANPGSLLANAALAMPTPALAQNTAWAGLDALVFGDPSLTASSDQGAAVLLKMDSPVIDEPVSCEANADGSGEKVNDDACAPVLDIEQLCSDLKADTDNTSELPEACEAQLSEDVNAQTASNESDATQPINVGLAVITKDNIDAVGSRNRIDTGSTSDNVITVNNGDCVITYFDCITA
ncbi:hypothetical protein N9141_01370, partial [bacterium]|nr:hypothetical protein [bacterium]